MGWSTIRDQLQQHGCCRVGSFDHQIPMAIGGRVHGIDACVADVVAALNAAGLTTAASCCGHDQAAGRISTEAHAQAIYAELCELRTQVAELRMQLRRALCYQYPVSEED